MTQGGRDRRISLRHVEPHRGAFKLVETATPTASLLGMAPGLSWPFHAVDGAKCCDDLVRRGPVKHSPLTLQGQDGVRPHAAWTLRQLTLSDSAKDRWGDHGDTRAPGSTATRRSYAECGSCSPWKLCSSE